MLLCAGSASGMELGCRLLYLMGSYEEALAQCQKDVGNKQSDAAEVLTLMYKNGQGVTQSNAEADKWARIASKLQNEDSKFRSAATTVDEYWIVCQSVFSGRGDYENTTEACRKAADLGHREAQLQLAWRFANGYGVPQDQTEAAKWYRKAAERGDKNAQYELAKNYCTYEIVGVSAKQEKEKWYLKAANQGHALAQYELATTYLNEGRPNYVEAIRWYRVAAESGDAKFKAQFVIKTHGFEFGDVEVSIVESQYQLGKFYQRGQRVPQDYSEAIQWYRKAGEHGHRLAQFNLGQMYALGQGMLRDYVQAHMWLNLAAARGLPEAAKARDSLAEKMTTYQILKAQDMAKEWSQKKAQ